MPTTPADIRGWLEEARRERATHVIVVCDTFDHTDYPVNVQPGDNVETVLARYQDPNNMQRVMEVYAMHLDLEEQLAERRAYHPVYAEPLPLESVIKTVAKMHNDKKPKAKAKARTAWERLNED